MPCLGQCLGQELIRIAMSSWGNPRLSLDWYCGSVPCAPCHANKITHKPGLWTTVGQQLGRGASQRTCARLSQVNQSGSGQHVMPFYLATAWVMEKFVSHRDSIGYHNRIALTLITCQTISSSRVFVRPQAAPIDCSEQAGVVVPHPEAATSCSCKQHMLHVK